MQQRPDQGKINSHTSNTKWDVPTSSSSSDRSITLHISKGKKIPIPTEY